MDAIYPAYGRQQRIDLIVAGQGGLVNVLTGDTAAGNPGLTSMSGLVGVAIGATVAGTGIPTSPAPTVIAASDSAHTVTMSASATGTATGENITFTNPAAVGFPGLERRDHSPLQVNPVAFTGHDVGRPGRGRMRLHGLCRKNARGRYRIH